MKTSSLVDFTITPSTPDGIRVEVVFHVDTWVDLMELMARVDA